MANQVLKVIFTGIVLSVTVVGTQAQSTHKEEQARIVEVLDRLKAECAPLEAKVSMVETSLDRKDLSGAERAALIQSAREALKEESEILAKRSALILKAKSLLAEDVVELQKMRESASQAREAATRASADLGQTGVVVPAPPPFISMRPDDKSLPHDVIANGAVAAIVSGIVGGPKAAAITFRNSVVIGMAQNEYSRRKSDPLPQGAHDHISPSDRSNRSIDGPAGKAAMERAGSTT